MTLTATVFVITSDGCNLYFDGYLERKSRYDGDIVLTGCVDRRARPYQHDSTASRPLSEVKHVRAWLVLRWGTTLESQVLFSLLFPSTAPVQTSVTYLFHLATTQYQ